MRIIGCCGWASLAAAAGLGYFAGQAHHKSAAPIRVGRGELLPVLVADRSMSAVEVFDLCNTSLQPIPLLPNTDEPPLAEALPADVQLVRYDFPEFLPETVEPPLADPLPVELLPLPPSIAP